MVDERYLPSLMQNWDRKSYLSKNTIVDEFRYKTENVEWIEREVKRRILLQK